LQSLIPGNATYVTVLTNGAFVVDFGVESAGWIEFDSPDLGDPAAAGVTMTVSEYNQPLPPLALVETKSPTPVPVRYGQTSYRLELNPELYEGVRFGFMWINNCTRPWHITGFRLVCQIKVWVRDTPLPRALVY
jgi:alpha-L-rhamnosidase